MQLHPYALCQGVVKVELKHRVAVKTTCRMTKTAKVGYYLGQGTARAGLVSQAKLDHGLNNYFGSCQDIMHFDVGAPCLDVDMARLQATLLASLMKQKELLTHLDQTGFLIPLTLRSSD